MFQTRTPPGTWNGTRMLASRSALDERPTAGLSCEQMSSPKWARGLNRQLLKLVGARPLAHANGAPT